MRKKGESLSLEARRSVRVGVVHPATQRHLWLLIGVRVHLMVAVWKTR
jgi:hypothetical protein